MDHSRVDISGSSISCGVGQISRLSDEQEENLFAIAAYFYHPAHGTPKAFLLWSNLSDQATNGHRLAKAVEEHGFGKVTVSDPALNGKTGNCICIWMWKIKHRAFKKWFLEQKVAKLKKRAAIN